MLILNVDRRLRVLTTDKHQSFGQTSIEEIRLNLFTEYQEKTGVNPYFGIGAKMQPIYAEKLELSVELQYQDLQSDYSATSFTVGARFSL